MNIFCYYFFFFENFLCGYCISTISSPHSRALGGLTSPTSQIPTSSLLLLYINTGTHTETHTHPAEFSKKDV